MSHSNKVFEEKCPWFTLLKQGNPILIRNELMKSPLFEGRVSSVVSKRFLIINTWQVSLVYDCLNGKIISSKNASEYASVKLNEIPENVLTHILVDGTGVSLAYIDDEWKIITNNFIALDPSKNMSAKEFLRIILTYTDKKSFFKELDKGKCYHFIVCSEKMHFNAKDKIIFVSSVSLDNIAQNNYKDNSLSYLDRLERSFSTISFLNKQNDNGEILGFSLINESGDPLSIHLGKFQIIKELIYDSIHYKNWSSKYFDKMTLTEYIYWIAYFDTNPENWKVIIPDLDELFKKLDKVSKRAVELCCKFLKNNIPIHENNIVCETIKELCDNFEKSKEHDPETKSINLSIDDIIMMNILDHEMKSEKE